MRSRKSLYILILIILAGWPNQSVALVVSTCAAFVFFLFSKVYTRRALSFAMAFLCIGIMGVARNGLTASLNVVFSLVLLLPLYMLIFIRELKIKLSLDELKKLLEVFLAMEVSATAINVVYFTMYPRPGSQMVDFGDLISGMMHYPFTYHADSANKTFTFLMIVTLALYLSQFGWASSKKSVVALAGLVILLSGVNHLILIGAIAIAAAYVRNVKKSVALFGLAILGGAIFAYVNPQNFRVVGEKLSMLSGLYGSPLNTDTSVDKLVYFSHSWELLLSNPISALFFGMGPGTYASRAAELLGGTLDPNFILHSSSHLFDAVIGPLYDAFDAKPQYQKGAFYFPYDDIISLSVEYGFVYFAVFNALIFFRVSALGWRFAVFLLVFLVGAGFVDHYYEYTAATLPICILILLMCGASESRPGALIGLRENPSV